MSHSGVCLPRQYTAFAGIVYGQKTRRFFVRLVAEGHASMCRCLHNRATVYHVHGRALYRAFGAPHSRLRRPVPLAAVGPRLMLLDAVLASPNTNWLADGEGRGLPLLAPLAGLLRRTLGTVAVGLEPDGSLLLVSAAAASSLSSLGPLVRRLRPLLEGVPSARVRVFQPADLSRAIERREGVAEPVLEGLRLPGDMAVGAFANRLTLEPLPHRYGHLLPLVADGRIPDLVAVEGEQRGEQPAARSRPPSRSIPVLSTFDRPASTPVPPSAASSLVTRSW
jgi:hypothetical protein